GRRDDAVHGRRQQGQLQQVRAEPPGDVDVLSVARAPAGHDRDVVEPVRAAGLLAATDLNLQPNPPPSGAHMTDGPGRVYRPGPPCRTLALCDELSRFASVYQWGRA